MRVLTVRKCPQVTRTTRKECPNDDERDPQVMKPWDSFVSSKRTDEDIDMDHLHRVEIIIAYVPEKDAFNPEDPTELRWRLRRSLVKDLKQKQTDVRTRAHRDGRGALGPRDDWASWRRQFFQSVMLNASKKSRENERTSRIQLRRVTESKPIFIIIFTMGSTRDKLWRWLER